MKTDTYYPSIKEERRKHIESRMKSGQVIPERICNASSPGLWTGTHLAYYRNDGHKSIKSRGLSC